MRKALAMHFDSGTGSADLVLGKTLVTDDWLYVVVFTTLFTNARAAADQVPAGETDRGGYWGDTFYAASHGSLLWTLRREKLDNNTLLRARDMCLTALAPLLTVHARAIDVQTQKLAKDRGGIAVFVTRLDGTTLPTITGEFVTDAA